MQSKSTDTTFTLNKLEYGQFTTSEHFGYLNAIGACLQIITTVFSTAQIIVAIDQADQIFVVILAGLFQLYSAVIRYLYAITIIQQQNRIERVKGKHSYFSTVISKMNVLCYSIDALAFSLMVISLNQLKGQYYITVNLPIVAVFVCVTVGISVVRNVSQFDSMLSQSISMVFVLVLLNNVISKNRKWIAAFCGLEIVASVLDAFSHSILVYKNKKLNKQIYHVYIIDVISQLARLGSSAMYYLFAFRLV
ncbi:Hypothetical_protein [Hexamita inflata]|uniref:Hypothetical_protein n=1 Tax=Hexamita inflata TaxID=28002 RepID=A0AA86QTS6_9EUKA|nr:Hypothetical protein HINF_LOCUS47063 [Hexamita inflata]